MGDNPPSKRIYFLGLLRVFMALKTLPCCGDSSSPEQKSALRAINTLNPPKEYIRKLRGLSPIHSTHRRRAQSLMWGARGPFLPAAAMVAAIVMPVVFCSKATEKRKKTKISWWLPKSLFITIYCKTYCNSYIANSSGVIFFCQWANLPLFFLLVFFLAGNFGANLPRFKTRANLPLFSF
jgi:hypothetical protein